MERVTHARARRWLGFSMLWLLVVSAPIYAQSNAPVPEPASIWATPVVDYDAIIAAEGYLRPPATIERIVAAPRHLRVTLSEGNLNAPLGTRFINLQGESMPSIANFAVPHYDLAGWLVDPAGNRSRNLTARGNDGLELISPTDGRRIEVRTPPYSRVGQARWSPDGTQVAFFVHTETDTRIYVADARNGRARQVTSRPVLATHVTNFSWTADSQHIITVLLPRDRGPEPSNAVPSSPKVRVTLEGNTRQRTHFSLLESPWEVALVEYYSTGQLARVNVRNRRIHEIGEPTMIRSLNASPDGKHFRVTRLVHPFSYHVPLSSFGNVEEIWDENGQALVRLGRRQLAAALRNDPVTAHQGNSDDEQDLPSGPPRRRSMGWRSDGPGFTFLQLEPERRGGDEERTRKDRVVHWLPPFTNESVEIIYEQENGIESVRYSDDGKILFISEEIEEGNRTRDHLFAVDLSDPTTKHTITRQGQDGPSGSLETVSGSRGETVVRLSPDGQHVYLSGTRRGDSEEEGADNRTRRYIDKLNFRTGELTNVYEGNPAFNEGSVTILDPEVTAVVFQRQSRRMVPQSFSKNLRSGEERQLTDNPDLAVPEWAEVRTRTLYAEREDGLTLRFRVSLPPGFRDGDKRPAMFWFYPREYTSIAAYERTWRREEAEREAEEAELLAGAQQAPGSYPNPPSVSSITLLTLLGYVVVQPDAPIIGPNNRMNDNYVKDLKANLEAVVDKLDEEGIADRNRLGIGGHSYGGFSTGNALVHTDLFRAGVAGASNFNRTLTPMGFQRERRLLWDARDTYISMSAFLHANQLNGALLMYHGMQDSNTGTHPINSERMFHALNGLGKDAALYMYPYEAHGQATLETRLDMWARWIAWLDKHVKYAGDPPTPERDTGSGGG